MEGEGSKSPGKILLKAHFEIGPLARKVFKPPEESPSAESIIDQAVRNNQIEEPNRVGFLKGILNKIRPQK